MPPALERPAGCFRKLVLLGLDFLPAAFLTAAFFGADFLAADFFVFAATLAGRLTARSGAAAPEVSRAFRLLPRFRRVEVFRLTIVILSLSLHRTVGHRKTINS